MAPIISKLYCSSSEKVFLVRRRPRVASGGGFVVVDCKSQKVVFKVDGCGILGRKEELILRDGDGNDLLLIRKKGGIVEALNLSKKWRGYTSKYNGSQDLVFTLKEPNACLMKNMITIEPEQPTGHRYFMVKGDFPARDCSILDAYGNVAAQVGVKKEMQEMIVGKDLYHVVVKPGMDQAFVFGVIAVLDYIYDGSTRC